MATTFTSPALNTPATQASQAGQPVTVYAELALTVAPVINDVYQMIKVPKGARIISWGIGSDDIDTATGVTLDLGDGGDVDRYVAATTIGQTGGVPIVAPLKTGYGYVYTADDTIDILASAAPTTFAAGTIRCHVTYIPTVTAS